MNKKTDECCWLSDVISYWNTIRPPPSAPTAPIRDRWMGERGRGRGRGGGGSLSFVSRPLERPHLSIFECFPLLSFGTKPAGTSGRAVANRWHLVRPLQRSDSAVFTSVFLTVHIDATAQRVQRNSLFNFFTFTFSFFGCNELNPAINRLYFSNLVLPDFARS